MKLITKRILPIFLAFVLMITIFPAIPAEAAKLSKKSLIVYVGKSEKMKLSGTTIKKVAVKNKKIATAKKKNSKTITVKGLKKGSTKVTVTGKNGKKYTFTVTVKNKPKNEATPEKQTTEAITTENPTTPEVPTTEKPTTENTTPEKPTTEKPTTEKPTTEESTSEKPVEERTLDRELTRAKSYQFIPESWFDMYKTSSKKQLTTVEYYNAVIELIKKVDADKVPVFKDYFISDMDSQREVLTGDGMLFTYLAVYELTDHVMMMDKNFDTVCNLNPEAIYVPDGMLLKEEKRMSAPLVWVNIRYDDWYTDFCAYIYMMNENTPVTGKPAFAFPEGEDAKFVTEKMSTENAIRSLSRVYEYIKSRRNEVQKQKIGHGIDELADERRQAILTTPTEVTYTGTAYYVAADGDDSNDGLSPEKPIKTLTHLNSFEWSMSSGDAVFFKRGDIFRGVLKTHEGVTYSAYGEGEKPILMTSPEDGAGAEKWDLYAEGEDGRKIWKYYRRTEPYGSIQFNNYTSVATKCFHRFLDGKITSIRRPGEEFDVTKDLNDLEFYNTNDEQYGVVWDIIDADKKDDDYSGEIYGELYLRCDAGNPGEIYSNIEFGTSAQNIINQNGIVIDNLCLYNGQCGMSVHQNNHQTVQNCEFAYGGGVSCGGGAGLSTYDKDGFMLVGGDGITLGGQYNLVKNNYVHDYWDNGIALEMLPDVGQYHDITFEGNLIENCNGGMCIANWFMNDAADEDIPIYENINIRDNYFLYSGYSWQSKALSSRNSNTVYLTSALTTGCNENVRFRNSSVSNNVFAMSKGVLIACPTIKGEPLVFSGNTYINDGAFATYYDSEQKYYYFYGGDDLDKVKKIFGDETGIYYINDRVHK